MVEGSQEGPTPERKRPRFSAWMTHLGRRGTRYFTQRPWPVISFSPILYLFVFGSIVRLWVTLGEPPPFEKAIGPGSYGIWLAMGAVSPIMALIALVLVERKQGIWRYQGMWLRLGADIGMFSVLLAYHISVSLYVPLTEVRIFTRYIIGAVLVFTLGLIVRDIWTLVVTERIARGRHE